MKRESSAAEKKRYEKPVVTRFPLRPEEAVLGFCKSSGASGPAGGDCTGTLGVCRTAGS